MLSRTSKGVFSRWLALGLVMAPMVVAAGCASGTLGKVSGSDDLPKELSADQKEKFEVTDSTVPAASASPSPELVGNSSVQPIKKKVVRKRVRKRKHHKGAKGAEPLVYPNLRPAKEPIWVGEKLTFDVTWLGLSAGDAVIESLPHKKIDGREVYHIRATAVTSAVVNAFYRINDMVESFIDYEGFFSHRFHIVLDETKQARDALELYDSEKAQTFYWNRWNHKEHGYSETKEFDPMPRFAQDSLSAMYYLRAMPLPDGAMLKFPIISEGKSRDAMVTVKGRETMRTPMGKIMTVMLELQPTYQGVLKKEGDIFLWLTDDDRRVPVRLQAKVKVGTIAAKLKAFEPGQPPGKEGTQVAPASAPSQLPSEIPAGSYPSKLPAGPAPTGSL